MDMGLTVAAALFALVASITPGPNNLLLAASGLSFGFKRTVPLILGIEVGFVGLLLAVAAGLGTVFERYPGLHTASRIAAVAYLLWLSWSLWRASTAHSETLARPVGFVRGALLQVLNPKAWMATVGAVGAYTVAGPGYWPSVAMVVAAFVLMGLPSITLWAAFGASFRRAIADRRLAQRVQRSMAIATALSCLLILR